jgi:hypothetical protein
MNIIRKSLTIFKLKKINTYLEDDWILCEPKNKTPPKSHSNIVNVNCVVLETKPIQIVLQNQDVNIVLKNDQFVWFSVLWKAFLDAIEENDVLQTLMIIIE